MDLRNLLNDLAVIPAKAKALYNSEAGQFIFALAGEQMDSRFRRNDGVVAYTGVKENVGKSWD